MADGSHSASLDLGQELVVDLFAGGGGASLGIARAYREPDVAINHNPVAVAVHRINHPNTAHYTCDVFEVDPLMATGGRPVGVLWASPDCRHHSKAKGGAPRSKRVRGLAWVIVKWAALTKPRLIHLENVEEFADWGPLDDNGKPVESQRGRTFQAFRAVLTTGLPADHPDMPEIIEAVGPDVPMASLVRGLRYTMDSRERVAANTNTPTIRKRLYVIARRDGRPIVWPDATHAKNPTGKLKPWRTAAECIDWSIHGRSIFGRKKDLARNTCRRVARGVWRYVLANADPFIVPLRGTSPAHQSVHGTNAPLSTISGQGTHHALVVPHLTEFANASTQRTFGADEPLRTQCAQVKGGHFALVSAHLTHLTHHGDRSGYGLNEPFKTVTAAHRGEQALVSAHLTAFSQNCKGSDVREPMQMAVAGATRYGVAAAFFEQANGGFYDGDGRSATDPLSTICVSGANQRLVTAYLVKYYGTGGQWQGLDEPMHTVPTKDRMGLVEAVHLPADALTPEQLAGARRCARFMHEYLPEQFPELVDVILVDGYVLVDITLRMLVPRELARAQGFPDDYVIEFGLFEVSPGVFEVLPITKTDQVRLIGNSVCPEEAEALVGANNADVITLYRRLDQQRKAA